MNIDYKYHLLVLVSFFLICCESEEQRNELLDENENVENMVSQLNVVDEYSKVRKVKIQKIYEHISESGAELRAGIIMWDGKEVMIDIPEPLPEIIKEGQTVEVRLVNKEIDGRSEAISLFVLEQSNVK